MTTPPKQETEQDRRERLLYDIEAKRSESADLALEEALSVNDWIDRIRSACATAQQMARSGEKTLEKEVWQDVGSMALARMELLDMAGG